jgi:integrase
MTKRVRETIDPNGISIAAAARKYQKYGLTPSTLRGWVDAGSARVVKAPAFDGDAKLLDDAGIQQMLQRGYTPHRDNKGRRTRRSAPVAVATNGRPIAVPGLHVQYQPIAAAPVAETPVMVDQETSTRVWTDRYIESRRRRMGGTIRPSTKTNYDQAFRLFCEAFPVLPLEVQGQPPRWRSAIHDYVRGLQKGDGSGPMAENTKIGILRIIASFYNWAKREHGLNTPDLKDSGLVRGRGPQAIPIFWDEVREVLGATRNSSEYTLILTLAQTGCRLSEYHTIRPELMRDHWTYVWGKRTRSNRTGRRPLALPDDTYDALQKMFKAHGELVWVDSSGRVKPLAGPVQSTGVGAINLRDEGTFKVDPLHGMTDSSSSNIRRMVQDAGVYQPGKTAHAFRRGYQAEFVRNGGSNTFMRMIMGHFNVGDMDDLYTHSKIEDMVKDARAHAPRRFLTGEEPEDLDHEVTMAILEGLEKDPE